MILTREIKNNNAIIEIEIEGEKQLSKVPVILDTGFNGELMLTQTVISSLRLKREGLEEFIVASGDLVDTYLYSGFVHWFGRRRLVTILETQGKQNLLGMELLSNCEFTINRKKQSS